tara:strand:+ start:775 stop:2508 length:1734 start_codon:yes stop_codon:yes gene_type:complete
MKNIILSISILIPLFIYSQELDREFLDTLPEEMQEELEGTVEAKSLKEKPVYRKASTMIDKPGGIKMQDVFGSQFFDVMQSSFMPINEPNLDSSYVLDFGDVLEIQMVGSENSKETYSISRDGSININDIGKIYIAGISLENAISLIKTKASNIFIDVDTFVSLIEIRDIQVLITGNAYNPGIFTLSGNSNILHALSMAGGVSDSGSYREIQLIRNNITIATIDLYNLFIYGKSNFRERLRSGDTILVGPSKILASVWSGVRRPSTYEMKEGETFSDLISFANGIKDNTNTSSIRVQSLRKEKVILINYDLDKLQLTEVLNKDTLIIREYQYGAIKITGAVKSPGEYNIVEGDTVRQAVLRAGGYTDFAYPFGGYLANKKTLRLNEEARDSLADSFAMNSFERGIAESPSGSTNSMRLIIDQMKKAKTTGRVVAEFDLDVLEADPSLDIYLEHGDELFIPTITSQVYVFGEVNSQGAVRYSPEKSLEHYLAISGGVLETSDDNRIYVVNPNGSVVDYSKRNLPYIFAENNSVSIYPGSIIYVPRSTDIQNSTVTASIWAPILSSLALSLASLSALNN